MATVPLIALKPHRYDGRLVRKGHRFLAKSVDDATVLKLMRVAEDAPTPSAPMVPDPATEAPTVEDEYTVVHPVAEVDPALWPKPKRRYRRKDLVAEE